MTRTVPPQPGKTPEIDPRQRQPLALLDQDQVAGERQLEPAATGETAARGDGRLREVVELGPDPVLADRPARDRPTRSHEVGELLDVRAGAEGPLAGAHGRERPAGRVDGEAIEGRIEPPGELEREEVQGWVVEGDDRHTVPKLAPHEIGHRSGLSRDAVANLAAESGGGETRPRPKPASGAKSTDDAGPDERPGGFVGGGKVSLRIGG